MPKVYNLYYDSLGNIKSYHEGGAVAPADETPPGLKLLALEGEIEIWDKKSFRLTHRVDPATLNLVPLKAPKILTPIEEPKPKEDALGGMLSAAVNTTTSQVVPGATNTNPKSLSVETQSDVHTVRE